MTLTPAIKGQLTKAMKSTDATMRFRNVRVILARHMPAQQAKHAARKYLRALAS